MNDRIERLQSEAARLDVARSGSRDGLFQTAAVVAMVLGVVGAFVAYQASLGSDDPRDIQSLIILAITALGLVIVGAVVFLRYSLAKFLRFWLLRQLYEGQAHVDELVASFNPTSTPSNPSASAGLGADRVVGDRNGGRGEDQLDAAGHAAPDLADGQATHDPATQDG
jgi:preprotein translocase subunit Sss1